MNTRKRRIIIGIWIGLALAAIGLTAATITSLNAVLPDIGPVFTTADQAVITGNATITNTNFANVNAALATLTSAFTLVDCATTAACPSTAETPVHTVIGRGTLATGSPSTYAVTTISPAFTGANTYVCTAQDTTTIANNIGVLAAGYVSGSAVTFTGPNTNTDGFRFTCVGY
jgi:hypothetical protein